MLFKEIIVDYSENHSKYIHKYIVWTKSSAFCVEYVVGVVAPQNLTAFPAYLYSLEATSENVI
jgi:hypothetical protein